MSKISKPPQPLSKSLYGFLRGLGIDIKVKEFEIIEKWPSITGSKIAAATTPDRVSEGVLYVKVKNSSWRNELIYMKHDILERIEKKFGRGIVKDIRYI